MASAFDSVIPPTPWESTAHWKPQRATGPSCAGFGAANWRNTPLPRPSLFRAVPWHRT